MELNITEIYTKSFLQRTALGLQNSFSYRRVSDIEVLPKLAYSASKTCSKLLGYDAIHLKVCQEAGVERRKSLMAVYQRISCLYDNLEATDLRAFEIRKRANQRSGKECCCCGSYQFSFKKEVVGHVQQNISMIVFMFLSCPITLRFGHTAAGKRVNHGGDCGLEISGNFHFYEHEKAIQK